MKSIDDVHLQEEQATSGEVGQEEETVTAETQLHTETDIKAEDNMDNVSKKSQTYIPNKRINKYVEDLKRAFYPGIMTSSSEVFRKPKATRTKSQTKTGYIKYVSLAILTIQNAALGLSMRYARTRKDVEMFASTAAVVFAEILKLGICVVLVMNESGSIKNGVRTMYSTVILNIKDTLRVCVPSFLYVIQNNLLYVSASNLDAATYQVTYQLKLLTTAFFAVLVLKRRLKKWQWGALGLLVAGVALVQLSSTEKKSTSSETLAKQSKLLGFGAALAACFISGFAGIYFEKVLKESDISVWMRNVQLSLASIPFGIATHVISSGTITDLLRGFDGFVWYLVILQAAGGLIVAVVVKYADNILKGFATSVAIIISCIASIYIFNFQLTVQFAAGTVLVIGSIFLYGYVPKKPETRTSLSV